MYEWEERGKAHPEDVRFMALRGPLVVQGWGYDLEGKPVPNLADTVENAEKGIFTRKNLTDKFMNKWLRKRHTWPMAPVDLRLDRRRGVWTVPNSFRIIHARTTGGDIEAGGSRSDVSVVNMGTVFNDDGTPNTSGNIKVTNPEWSPSIASGGYFYAYYDTLDCTYYPIIPSGGDGSGGSGVSGAPGEDCCLISDGNPCCDRWATGLDYRDCDEEGGLGNSGLLSNFLYNHLVFNSGLSLSTISGAAGTDAQKVYINSERYVLNKDSAGVLMPLASTGTASVMAPNGESVIGRAWFEHLLFRLAS